MKILIDCFLIVQQLLFDFDSMCVKLLDAKQQKLKTLYRYVFQMFVIFCQDYLVALVSL